MTPDYPAKGKKDKKKLSPKAELARAVEELMRTPFPERSQDADADQLHADLLLFDSAVGETLVSVINGDWVELADLRPDSDLRQRLEQLAASDNTTTAADAATYLAYLTELEHLLALARVAIGKAKR